MASPLFAPLNLGYGPRDQRASGELEDSPRNGGGHVTSLRNPATVVSDNILAVGVYALYFLGYFTGGISMLIGLIIAHVKVGDADPVMQSHYRFQIGTFWYGLPYLVFGIPLSMLLIGIPIVAWWFVWSMVRVVKGVLLIIEHRPIARPRSWMFG